MKLTTPHPQFIFGHLVWDLVLIHLPTQQKEWPNFSRLFFKSGIVGISILVVLTAIVFGVADDFFQERFIDDEVNNLSFGVTLTKTFLVCS